MGTKTQSKGKAAAGGKKEAQPTKSGKGSTGGVSGGAKGGSKAGSKSASKEGAKTGSKAASREGAKSGSKAPSEAKISKKRASEAPAPGGDAEGDDRPKRALGLRGAAPWAARHAAKHAAEARKRAAEPPPPGSARATIRTPSGVEEIKAQVVELHNHIERIKSLRKNLAKTFFDIGLVLREVQSRGLYRAKGFQSFEAFVEREVDLGKTQSARLVRLVTIFQREAALELGMDRALEALVHLEGGAETTTTPTSEARLPVAKPAMPSSATRGPIVGR